MDLIRRSELLSVFKRWERVPDYNEAERNIIKAAIYEAENIPAVDAVEVRHGHWVRHYNADIGWHTCSECGEEIWNPDIEREKYCWNCGAKMDGEDGDT